MEAAHVAEGGGDGEARALDLGEGLVHLVDLLGLGVQVLGVGVLVRVSVSVRVRVRVSQG